VYVTTGDPESLVVVPDGLGIRRLEQAVHLAVRIVEQLDLANAEFVELLFLRILSDLLDRLIRKLQIVVKIHELGHW
jgi:hypothetical protein